MTKRNPRSSNTGSSSFFLLQTLGAGSFRALLVGYGLVSQFLLLGACSSYDLGDKSPVEVEIDATSPTWSQASALVESKCMNCHATPRSPYAPTNTPPLALSSGQGFYDAVARIKARVFEDTASPMPPNFGTPLVENERAGLRAFIDAVEAAKQSNSPSPIEGIAAGTGQTSSLSAAFASNCAGCHGAQGQGSGSFPKLQNTSLSGDAFLAKVRQGGGGMPAFAVSAISDATLQTDYTALKNATAASLTIDRMMLPIAVRASSAWFGAQGGVHVAPSGLGRSGNLRGANTLDGALQYCPRYLGRSCLHRSENNSDGRLPPDLPGVVVSN